MVRVSVDEIPAQVYEAAARADLLADDPNWAASHDEETTAMAVFWDSRDEGFRAAVESAYAAGRTSMRDQVAWEIRTQLHHADGIGALFVERAARIAQAKDTKEGT